MLDKKVSIIVPVYNVEQYIEECIQSIITQTYSNLEIILVDDGSTDNSRAICEKFAMNDSRIELMSKRNAGVSSARNLGLHHMTGDFVTFVDSDDWLEADYIEQMVEAFDSKTDIVCCNVPASIQKLCGTITDSGQKAYVFTEFGYVWGKMIKAGCVDTMFDENIWYAEDFLFYIFNIKNISAMKILDYEGYHYRIRVGSLSVKDKTEQHTLREFENKYTFVKGCRKLEHRLNESDEATIAMVRNHCYYIFSLLMLLAYRLQKSGEIIEKEKLQNLRGNMKTYYGAFVSNTLCKRKNIKRFMFGTMLLISPRIGGSIADRLLE